MRKIKKIASYDNVPKISIRNLAKTFNTESGESIDALYNLDIQIYDREFVSIIGPSGCGKTTLLNIVAGLLLPTEGSITLDGEEIKGPGKDRGVVFQSDAIFLWRKVKDNVGYGLEIANVPEKSVKE